LGMAATAGVLAPAGSINVRPRRFIVGSTDIQVHLSTVCKSQSVQSCDPASLIDVPCAGIHLITLKIAYKDAYGLRRSVGLPDIHTAISSSCTCASQPRRQTCPTNQLPKNNHHTYSSITVRGTTHCRNLSEPCNQESNKSLTPYFPCIIFFTLETGFQVSTSR